MTMIDSPDILLDLTEYRNIAGFILALILLRQTQRSGSLGMKLRSQRDADWLAARLHKQGYDVVAIEPRGEQAVLKICKSD
jgi:hypothetical protein